MSKAHFKTIVTIVLVLIIIFWLTLIDYSNFFSKNNSGAFLGILAPLLIILSIQMQKKIIKITLKRINVFK